MDKLKQHEPTFPTPILVGSGPSADQAVDFLLNALEWALREDNPGLLYPIEGEISNWIEQLWEKPNHVGRASTLVPTSKTVVRDVLRGLFAPFADPRNEEEKEIAGLFGGISLEESQRLASALQSNDVAGIEAVRTAILGKLGKQITTELTPSRLSALGSIVGKCRAGRAEALCLVLYKTHATVLINRARHGDAQAVLDLIKVDRLFLTDSCTAKVIRDALFQNDRPFFKQLARAIEYKRQLGWKKGCRLYLYVLFAMAVPLPPLAALHLRVDPQGTRFRTSAAFEKFVERCREDFDRIQADLLAGTGQEPRTR
jgi:hypothetical protein